MDPIFIFTRDGGLSIMFDIDTHVTVLADNPNFDDIKAAVKDHNWELARELCNPAREIEQAIVDIDDVRIENGIVYWQDTPIHLELTERMLEMVEEGFDVKPLGMFLTNLMENPSSRAVDELFGFLEKGKMPITEDGCFLAYKRVRQDWTDCHSGRISNAIGVTVSMTRNKVDDNCNNTCSSGLHFCSREYLRSFGGARLIAIKINPRDVVSIPIDYNNAKGRCCKYEVIQEIEAERRLEGSYMNTNDLWDDDEYDPEDIDVDFNIHPLFVGVDSSQIGDDDGYIDALRTPELCTRDIDDLMATEIDTTSDDYLANGLQYWVGDVGPFRSHRDASTAKAIAYSIRDV